MPGRNSIASVLQESFKLLPIRHLIRQEALLKGRSKEVAGFLIRNLRNIDSITVEGISAQVGVSRSTILRTIHILGYRSFEEFSEQIGAALPYADEAEGAHASADPYFDAAQRTIRCVCDTFAELHGQAESLEEAARLMVDASQVQIYGASLSAGIGALFHAKLTKIGRASQFTSDPQSAGDSLRILSAGGILFAVSQMAVNPVVGRLLASARKSGVPTILLTNGASSPAADQADVVIATGVADRDLTHDYLPGRAAQVYALEALLGEVERLESEIHIQNGAGIS